MRHLMEILRDSSSPAELVIFSAEGLIDSVFYQRVHCDLIIPHGDTTGKVVEIEMLHADSESIRKNFLQSLCGLADHFGVTLHVPEEASSLYGFVHADRRPHEELVETPIADYAFIGDPKIPGTFEEPDLKAISNPKWHAKLIKTFSRVPFPVNIYLLNGVDNKVNNGLVNDSDEMNIPRKRNVTITALNLGIILPDIQGCYKPDDFEFNFGFLPPNYTNSLSVLFTNNFGDEKMPLTSWMVAHRIIHAISVDQTHYTRNNGEVALAFASYWRAIQSVMQASGGKYLRIRGELRSVGTPSDIYSKVSNLKSAQNRDIKRGGEFYIELATQAFLTGDFYFNLDSLDLSASDREDSEHYLVKARAALQKCFALLKGKMFVL